MITGTRCSISCSDERAKAATGHGALGACRRLPIQHPGAGVAKALHEAVAHQGRVAGRLDLAGLVVDLGNQQDRAALREALTSYILMDSTTVPVRRLPATQPPE